MGLPSICSEGAGVCYGFGRCKAAVRLAGCHLQFLEIVMRGFIYVVTTVGKDYQQSDRQRDVPTIWEDRLVFGPCKVNMRPKMNYGDYVFGISPSGAGIRRIVFAAKIGEVLTFEERRTSR